MTTSGLSALRLEAFSTALVTIDLQKGILPSAKVPRDGAAVLASAIALTDAFRAARALVVRVKVGFSPDLGDLLHPPVDEPSARAPLPSDWLDDPDELPTRPGDLLIVKRQWGAFNGTELDLQLRRRGIRTLVLGGISTAIGVESTARFAWELGYEIVFPEELSSAAGPEQHAYSFKHIFPRLGRVRATADVVAALG